MKFNNSKFISSKFKFLFFILLFGIIIGMTIHNNLDSTLKDTINNSLNELIINIKTTKQNNIIYHLSILSIITLTSCFIIGISLYYILYIYEGISIGFLISSFIHYKKIKGIYYSLIFILINKTIYLIILTYILYISTIYLINYINKRFIINNMKDYIKKQVIAITLILINDIILYNIGNYLLNIFI